MTADTTLALDRLIDARRDIAPGRPGEPAGDGSRHGPFRGLRRGQGTDYDDLRPYAEGDDLRHVDWRTSARRDELHTRLYREEKAHVVTVALDLRGATFTGSATLRAVTAGLVAARLAWCAASGGARTAVVALDDDAVTASPTAAGERGALAACKLIADTFARGRARAVADTGASDGGTLEPLLAHLQRRARQDGATLLVTGMDTPGPRFDAALERLATDRRLAVVLVEDPLDRQAPPAARYRYAGVGGPRHIVLDRRRCRRLDALLATRREAIVHCLANAHVPLIPCHEGAPSVITALRDAALLP